MSDYLHTDQTEVVIDKLIGTIDEIGMDVLTGVTLADAMRLGSKHTNQAQDWGAGENACALAASYLAAVALGYIK